MSDRGRSYSSGGHGCNGGRGSVRTHGRSQNNDNDNDNDNDETEKVDFTLHHAGRNQQGATCDTVKKQTMHDIRG